MRRCLIGLRLLVVLSTAAATAFPGPVVAGAAAVSVRSPSLVWNASLTRTGSDAGGFARYELAWSNSVSTGTSTISSDIERVRDFRILDSGRAVIAGPTRVTGVWSFHLFTLTDARTIVVADCYDPAISPGGRFIAYVRIHPQRRAAAHEAAPERMSAVYQVLDLAGDGTHGPSPFEIPMPAGRGWPDPSHLHALAEPFTWTDDRHFRFADGFRGAVTRMAIQVIPSGEPVVDAVERL